MDVKTKRIVHFSSVHPVFDSRIFVKECRSLAQAGYQVTLIAVHPADAVVDSVQIRAIPKASGRLRRMIASPWRIYRLALREKADLYHFHDPELIPLGLLLKLSGKRVVYDAHEIVSRQILSKAWIPPRLRKVISQLAEAAEMLGGFFFDGIIGAVPGITKRFPQKKSITIHNFPRQEELLPSTPVPYDERPPVITYIGNSISVQRGIIELVEALSLLPETLEARLELAGRFPSAQLEEQARQMPGWKRVDFRGWVEPAQIIEILERSRIGIFNAHPAPNILVSYPIKLFEYMAAGLPVIFSDILVWREIIDGANCGLLVDPANPQALAEAVQYLLQNPQVAREMGLSGKRAVEERYNWAQEERKLLDFYAKLLTPAK